MLAEAEGAPASEGCAEHLVSSWEKQVVTVLAPEEG